MVNMLILLQDVPVSATQAAKSLIDYGVIGAVLVLALLGIAFMYVTNNKKEKERHESYRTDVANIMEANSKERERWQEIDNQRFEILQQTSKAQNEASVKVAVALEQLGTIIKERIK